MESQITRRGAIMTVCAAPFAAAAGPDEDGHGKSRGYPTSARQWEDKPYRVGNYSNLAAIRPTNVVRRGGPVRSLIEEAAVPADERLSPEARQRLGDHVRKGSVTGLMVLQGSNILHEEYGYGRTATSAFHGFSMTKTILSLLVGIALEEDALGTLQDPAEKYVPELKGTLHGATKLKDLLQMSTGADVLHKPTSEGGHFGRIYGDNLHTPYANSMLLVKGWNQRKEPAGQRFNYNELAPLTITHVLCDVARRDGGKTLSEYASARLWSRIGAQDDASWQKDSKGIEIGCIGFSAALRDWARLGLLTADDGAWNGAQIVPRGWLQQMSTVSEADQHLRPGVVSPGAGYGYFTWIEGYRQRRVFSFRGHHNQFVIVAPALRLVVAQTAVDTDSAVSLYANFTALMAELERRPVPTV